MAYRVAEGPALRVERRTGCTPSCAGRACGDDGCGGTCGTCVTGWTCQGGTCVEPNLCVPACEGKECGLDGCGGACGACQPPLQCSANGQCYDAAVCVPACGDRACGDDGCGGPCGVCKNGQTCSVAGRCEGEEIPRDRDVPPGSDTASGTDLSGPGTGCPAGTVLSYGSCVAIEVTPAGGGCAAGAAGAPLPASLLPLLAAGVALLSRRRRCP